MDPIFMGGDTPPPPGYPLTIRRASPFLHFESEKYNIPVLN